MVFTRIEFHSTIRLTTSTQVLTEERSQLPLDYKAVTCQAFTKAWKQHAELHLNSHPHNIRREDIISQAYERFQGSCKSQSVHFQPSLELLIGMQSLITRSLNGGGLAEIWLYMWKNKL
ncbi:hypothetical protein LWI28_011545 [Acer negundo]|uniref:Uncharacterized protein n=1 Tax=Acer negundo TaxID=4023 RepID=A0AAD5IDP5_ACENE|nr:hypothetical protein LWI28_011545 [Acer negundo]